MALQIPYVGESRLLIELREYMQNSTDIWLGLYTSPLAFDAAAVLDDYLAIEADYDGYSRQRLDAWGAVSVPDAEGRAIMTHAPIYNVCVSVLVEPVTVYGYFVFDDGVDTLLWVEEADTPVVIFIPADFYTVIPKFTLTSEF